MMKAELQSDQSNLYETDYLAWIEKTVEQLKQRDFSSVDWENLIEEIVAMGRSERRSLESNLVVILLHLLKWQYQPDRRSGSWRGSITEHRRRVRKAIAIANFQLRLDQTILVGQKALISSVYPCLSKLIFPNCWQTNSR